MFPKDDLLAFWKLDDLKDSRGNRYTLTNNGGVQFVAGKIGNCAEFDGSNRLTTTLSETLNLQTQSSISFWVKLTSYPGSIGVFVGSFPDTGLALFIRPGNNTLVVADYLGGEVSFNQTISLNVWHHIVLTTNDANLNIYYDNTLLGSGSNILLNINSFCLNDGTYTWSGNLDAVGIWNRALTLQEIQTLYNNGNGLEPEGILFLEDSSTNNFQLTLNGDAKLNTTITKYGSGSASFDGNGDYLTIANNDAFNFGTGDFTIEAWVYLESNSGARVIISKWNNNGSNDWLAFITGSTLYFESIGAVTGTANILNQWAHIAIVRSSGTIFLYVNGTQVGSGSNNNNLSGTSNVLIGANDNGANYLQGYIDDLRITKGIARYTANFTPPTQQLPSPSDPYISNVSLLLHMDGTNGSQTFTDSSTNNFTLTAFGDAQIDTAIKKFGSGAAYFDGNGDYALATNSSAFNFSNGDFTVEFWTYFGAQTQSLGAFVTTASPNDAQGIFIGVQSNNQIQWLAGNGAWLFSQVISTPLATDSWNHIAYVRNGTSLIIFVNGVQADTYNIGTTALTNTNNRILIGGRDDASQYFSGYIDELRITKGVARYTSNFVPQTAPFANPVATIPIGALAFWKLDDLNDSSANGNTLTNNGSVQFVAGKIGNCAQFNGNNELTDTTFTPTFNSAQDFSISFWANPSTNTTGTTVGGSGDGVFNIHNNSDGSMSFNNAQSADVSVPNAFTVGTWKHYVCIKAGNNRKVYINGSLVYNQTSSVSYNNTTNTISIGRYPGGTLPFQGLIDAVGIWQRELTSEEITTLYNNGNGLEP